MGSDGPNPRRPVNSYARSSRRSKRWKSRKKTLRMAVKRGILTEAERQQVQARERPIYLGGPLPSGGCSEACQLSTRPICKCACGGVGHGAPLPKGMTKWQFLYEEHKRRMGQNRPRCSSDNCDNLAVSRGFCRRHRPGKPCSVDGCARPHVARGMCHKHYKRLRARENV